jgi:hypothetical protein
VTKPGRNLHPIAVAMEWVAKITVVGLEMALPPIGGGLLDRRLGTSYWALVGAVVGVLCGMAHLLQMTAAEGRRSLEARKRRQAGSDEETQKD